MGSLRVWLLVQLGIFCVLEPGSFLPAPTYTRLYLLGTVASFAADFGLLFAIFDGIRDEVLAPVHRQWWTNCAVIAGLGLALFASEFIPAKAHGIQIVWLATAQTLQYMRLSGLIVVAVYGCYVGSQWPPETAWAWLGMAVYSGADAIVERISLHRSSFGGSLQYVSTAAVFFELYAWWMSLDRQRDQVLTPEVAKGPQ